MPMKLKEFSFFLMIKQLFIFLGLYVMFVKRILSQTVSLKIITDDTLVRGRSNVMSVAVNLDIKVTLITIALNKRGGI